MNIGNTPIGQQPQVVPVWPWVAKAGRSALRHGVYVYAADLGGLTLAASNGSIGGVALRRYWLSLPREHLEDDGFDVADYAAREIRAAVNAGYKMMPGDEAVALAWHRAVGA